MLIITWSKQRNGNTSIQIFELAYFTREKAEKIGKNEM